MKLLHLWAPLCIRLTKAAANEHAHVLARGDAGKASNLTPVTRKTGK